MLLTLWAVPGKTHLGISHLKAFFLADSVLHALGGWAAKLQYVATAQAH